MRKSLSSRYCLEPLLRVCLPTMPILKQRYFLRLRFPLRSPVERKCLFPMRVETLITYTAENPAAGSPAEADLVFEIGFTNPFIEEHVSGGGGTGLSVSSRPVSDSQFRLVIIDPGTRINLWVFTEHIAPALLQGNRDKNFDQALNSLVNDLRNVAGQPVATASSGQK